MANAVQVDSESTENIYYMIVSNVNLYNLRDICY